MIVVEPSALRYEVGDVGISTEEHLLERISAAESKISRMHERIERCLELVFRNAQNAYFDRSLMKSLISLLADDGFVQAERLEHLWNVTCQQDVDEQQQSLKREELRYAILTQARGTTRTAFESLINEGFVLLDDHQLERGYSVLRRAADIGQNNCALDLFIGEYFFGKGKTKLAREYLARAYELWPDNVRLSLLLGLTCADDGDPELAKRLLYEAIEKGAESFALHYGLGRLFLAENDWKQALSEFKQALFHRPSPEAHYVLACLYYQLERLAPATRHLRKAITMDSDYREAQHLLALIQDGTKSARSANKSIEQSANQKARGQSRAGRKSAIVNLVRPVAPLFDIRAGSRRLITGSDKRVARALREDALREI